MRQHDYWIGRSPPQDSRTRKGEVDVRRPRPDRSSSHSAVALALRRPAAETNQPTSQPASKQVKGTEAKLKLSQGPRPSIYQFPTTWFSSWAQLCGGRPYSPPLPGYVLKAVGHYIYDDAGRSGGAIYIYPRPVTALVGPELDDSLGVWVFPLCACVAVSRTRALTAATLRIAKVQVGTVQTNKQASHGKYSSCGGYVEHLRSP